MKQEKGGLTEGLLKDPKFNPIKERANLGTKLG